MEREPGPGAEKYICSKAGIETLRQCLRKKPMKEIRKIIGIAVDLKAAERQAAEQEYLAAQERLRRNIPGLDELRAAVEEGIQYRIEFGRMMEDGDNDGARLPRRPKADPKYLAAGYPVAAAYLKAEGWACSAHHAKIAAGETAMKRIAAGEEFSAVIAEMEAEWSAYCADHSWD